ncbi:MAG: glycosyltransferase [Chloroflexi bacterium]|nr:glycosyltransferase [Chloroflexota bacterium]
MIERVAPDHRLRIAVVGDIDGIHTQSWLTYFVARGHDVHAVSYYLPARPPEGVAVHALRPAAGGGGRPANGARPGLASRLVPPGLQRLANLLRYRRAGLRRLIDEINPDVLHAHYLVEHGFYATSANFRPYVVSAWGSDVLVDAAHSTLNRAIARFTLRHASLATANNRHMAREMVLKLGIDRAAVQHIVLGIPREYIAGATRSAEEAKDATPTIISSRSLDSPLYNIDSLIRAMEIVHQRLPSANLAIAGEGRLRPQLESLAGSLGLQDTVRFVGQLSQDALRQAFIDADVFVSVPSSDGTSVALLQAMAVGAFPIVSEIPSQEELVKQGKSGLRVPPQDPKAIAEAIVRAIEDRDLRRNAAERNRSFVEEYGVLETNMARMEAWYYRLAGRTGEIDTARQIDTDA